MKLFDAVTLDVGGTLIEPWPSVGHLYAQVAQSFGARDVTPKELSDAFKNAWRGRQDFDYSKRAWRMLVNETFAGANGFRVSDECFDAIYTKFGHAAAWRVFDDVRPFLARAAREGVRLALISNWDERLENLLAELELFQPFDAVVASHEVGHRKPAREIFLQAAQRLALEANRILHVGDAEEEDFHGATAAGFQAVLLQRGGASGQGRISSLQEIRPIQ